MGFMDLLRGKPSQPRAFTEPPSIADIQARRTNQLNNEEEKRANQIRILVDAINRVLGATEFLGLDHITFCNVYGHDGNAKVVFFEPDMLVEYLEALCGYYVSKGWTVTSRLEERVPGRYQYQTDTRVIPLPQPPSLEDVRRLCPEHYQWGDVTGVISIAHS